MHGSSKQRMLFNTLIHAARTSVIIPLASSSHQETAKRSADVARLNTHVSRSSVHVLVNLSTDEWERKMAGISFADIRSKDYLRNVLRFTPLIHATTWPGYDCDRYIGGKLTLSQCLMHRLILFASIQVDDQSAARSPLRTLLRFFRVRVDRMWGSLWRKID